jgi:hypothetical protein
MPHQPRVCPRFRRRGGDGKGFPALVGENRKGRKEHKKCRSGFSTLPDSGDVEAGIVEVRLSELLDRLSQDGGEANRQDVDQHGQ